MFGVSEHGVFCDYMTVTCNPAFSFVDSIEDLLRSRLVCRVDVEDKKTLIRFSARYGTTALVRIDRDFYNRVDRIMFGGSSLDVLRQQELFGYVIQDLSAVPHNLTRLDVALDVELESAANYQSILGKIISKGHAGNIVLCRKCVLPHKVKPIISPRATDGVMSGSVMFNHRADRYSGIVYDKTAQLFDRFGVLIAENILRYEMRSSEASLRDAVACDSLFFSLASPDLLSCPANVDPWSKLELAPLNLEPLPELTQWQRIQKILDSSLDIECLGELLRGSSPATISMARKRLDQRLDALLATDTSKSLKTA
jgi:hypothetical protein